MFGVDRRTVLNWARNGRLKSQRTAGGHRRYREADAVSLLTELEAAA
jgi:excisionase family DNA binding protein